ncbi:MAG: cupin domain-containing protein [Proteobacteria bacterium]|nr:cupin domain-containing protein [Pseudomonadota bacterium]
MRFSILVLAFAMAASSAMAQDLKRTILQRVDVPTDAAHETVIGTVEVPRGGATGRHSHFGVEMIVMIEGEMDVLIDGEAPRHLKAGDSLVIPAGKIHDAKAASAGAAKAAVTWVVEKGKPMATPAAK